MQTHQPLQYMRDGLTRWLEEMTRADGAPDDPGVNVLAANDKAIHEEDTQQQQHASSIGNHNLAGGCGNHAVDANADLVGQEQQGQKHEEPAAFNKACQVPW